MENLKLTNEVEREVKKILSSKVTEEAGLKEQLEKDSKAIKAADQEMIAATAAGNLAAYQSAKAERQNALDAHEMHNRRLKDLESGALMSGEEYKQAVNKIYGEINRLEHKTKEKLYALSLEMKKEADKLEQASEYANEVLKRLQAEIYRDNDRTRRPDGEIIFIDIDTKKVDTRRTILWGRAGVEHPNFDGTAGGKA